MFLPAGLQRPLIRPAEIAWLAGLLEGEGVFGVRAAIKDWRSQRNGVINAGLSDAILTYRAARLSQAEIMAPLKVSKSTVYRCTRGRLPRIRVTRQQQAARLATDPVACERRIG